MVSIRIQFGVARRCGYELHDREMVFRFPEGARDFLCDFMVQEDGTDRLSRNVGKKLPLLAA